MLAWPNDHGLKARSVAAQADDQLAAVEVAHDELAAHAVGTAVGPQAAGRGRERATVRRELDDEVVGVGLGRELEATVEAAARGLLEHEDGRAKLVGAGGPGGEEGGAGEQQRDGRTDR